MLAPRKVKYRKRMKGNMKGNANSGNAISFGKFALKSTERGLVSARQIEAARRAMTRYVKRGGKIWIRIFPDRPITKKSAETPMGGGKGAVDHYASVIKPGRVLFEMDGVDESVAREALRLAAHKLSVKTKLLIKHGAGE